MTLSRLVAHYTDSAIHMSCERGPPRVNPSPFNSIQIRPPGLIVYHEPPSPLQQGAPLPAGSASFDEQSRACLCYIGRRVHPLIGKVGISVCGCSLSVARRLERIGKPCEVDLRTIILRICRQILYVAHSIALTLTSLLSIQWEDHFLVHDIVFL